MLSLLSSYEPCSPRLSLVRGVAKSIFAAITLALLLGVPAFAQIMDRATLRWINAHPSIDSIAIDGNSFYTDNDIRKRLFSKRFGSFLGIPLEKLKNPRAVYVQRETIARDTAELKAMYYSAGFLGVAVREELVALSDASALVKITIQEGRRFLLGAVTIDGDYPSSLTAGFSKAMKPMIPHKPLNAIVMRQTQFALKEVMANEGYPYGSVGLTLDTMGHADSVVALYTIVADSLVHYGEITVDSAPRYGVNSVRRELRVKPGAIYRRRDILLSQRSLIKSGYFTSSQIEPADSVGADRYRPSFRVRVKEKKANYWSFLSGVSQDTIADITLFGQALWGKRNFLGNRRLEVGATGSVSRFSNEYFFTHRYRLRYTQPWLFGVNMPATFKVEFEPGVRSLLQPFRVQRTRFDFSLNREFNETRSLSFGVQYEAVSVFDVDSAALDSVRQSFGITVRRKIYFSARKDTRDDLFSPSNGSHGEFKADFVGGLLGGDESFMRLDGEIARFRRSWWGAIFATRLRAGYSFPFGENNFVPAIDRFFVGGANTIRGFAKDELGPTFVASDGQTYSLGGEFYGFANIEFRRRVIRQFWSSFFIDAGNAWRKIDDPYLSFAGMAYGYGVGIQYHSPAGPVRLDYARSIRTERYDAGSRWHFSILYAF